VLAARISALKCGVDHVVHLLRQHAADGVEQQATAFHVGVLGQRGVSEAHEQRHGFELFHGDQAGAHAVVDVVGVVGDLIGEVAQLGLQAGLRAL